MAKLSIVKSSVLGSMETVDRFSHSFEDPFLNEGKRIRKKGLRINLYFSNGLNIWILYVTLRYNDNSTLTLFSNTPSLP